MIIMLHTKESNIKKDRYVFIIVYYARYELEKIKELPNLETVKDKYKFTTSYIGFQNIIKEWRKLDESRETQRWIISIPVQDFPALFGVHSIKRNDRTEQEDRREYIF